jgi:hypothetical protein
MGELRRQRREAIGEVLLEKSDGSLLAERERCAVKALAGIAQQAEPLSAVTSLFADMGRSAGRQLSVQCLQHGLGIAGDYATEVLESVFHVARQTDAPCACIGGLTEESLQKLADNGITVITPEVLVENGVTHKKELVKILGRGELTAKVEVRAHAFSAKAKEMIEAAGGTCDKYETK